MNQETMEKTGKLVNVQQACEILGVGRSTVFKLIDNRRLRSVKIGSARRIWTRDLEAFMASLVSDQDQIVQNINQLAYEGPGKASEIEDPLDLGK
jgi:excisionase family DNA binding protein